MEEKTTMIDTREDTAAKQLADTLRGLLDDFGGDTALALLCIGSDRATGDALGPLAGHLLGPRCAAPIYGNLKKPVHAGNLEESLAEISAKHTNPLIIAIDACLGSHDTVGKLMVKKGGLTPGIAGSKRLPRVGHISIAGVVNLSAASMGLGQSPLTILSSTRLGTVMHMAEVISDGVAIAVKH